MAARGSGIADANIVNSASDMIWIAYSLYLPETKQNRSSKLRLIKTLAKAGVQLLHSGLA